jgi:PAS domain-containing protein
VGLSGDRWPARTRDRRSPRRCRREALAAGEDVDVEYRLRGADGVTRWVHDRAATRLLADGTVEISGIVADVSERRRMRAELAEAHAALSRVVEAMDDHLFTLRVEADGGYQTVYRGPHRDALAGGPLAPGAAGDRVWESLVHPDDRERWADAVAGLVHARPIELEYRLVGLDGVERIVLDRLRPRRETDGTLFYDGATRDITERRRLKRSLASARRVDASSRRVTSEMMPRMSMLPSARRSGRARSWMIRVTPSRPSRRYFASASSPRSSAPLKPA